MAEFIAVFALMLNVVTFNSQMPDPVDAVLREYDRSVCPFQSFDAHFNQIIIHHELEVVSRGAGRIYCDASGRAMLKVVPADVKRLGTSKRYQLVPCASQKLIWKDSTLFGTFGEETRLSKQAVPARPLGPSWEFRIPLTRSPYGNAEWHVPEMILPPVVTGESADGLKRKFQISFVKKTGNDTILSFVPGTPQGFTRYRQMDVQFDPLGTPLAVKRYYMTKNVQEVLVFERKSVRINRPLQPADDPLEMEPKEFECLHQQPLGRLSGKSSTLGNQVAGLFMFMGEALWWEFKINGDRNLKCSNQVPHRGVSNVYGR